MQRHNEQPITAAAEKGVVTPWLTVNEAAARARCGIKTIYKEVNAARLRGVKLGGRRELRLKAEWVDAWLEAGTI